VRPVKVVIALVAMKITSVAAVSAALSALTVGMSVGGIDPVVPASAPLALNRILPKSPSSVPVSRPTGISWSWDWESDDDDWAPSVSWDCPEGCSITFEEGY
jgi:hypothetical protein